MEEEWPMRVGKNAICMFRMHDPYMLRRNALMRNLYFLSEISTAQFSKLDFNMDMVRDHTSTL